MTTLATLAAEFEAKVVEVAAVGNIPWPYDRDLPLHPATAGRIRRAWAHMLTDLEPED